MVVLEERRQLGALPEQLKPVEAQSAEPRARPVLSEQQAPEEPLPREARAGPEAPAVELQGARQSVA